MRRIAIAIVVSAGVCASGQSAPAAVIAQWNFNGGSATTVPGGETSPAPSTGAGTATLVGGTTAAASFGSGSANGGSSDPVATTPANYGWQTTSYPAASVANKTAGTQFSISTAGVVTGPLYVYYDLRHSNTSSRFEQVQYTTDGSTWIDGPSFSGAAGDTWFRQREVLLTDPLALNNTNFAFRILAAFDPAGSAYMASNSSSTYAGSGTWRLDMVTLQTTAIPEPASFALAAGSVLALRRRR